MNDVQLVEAIAAAPIAANIFITWERPAKMRAKYKGMPMTKRTTMLLRLGVDYDKMQDVQEARADGSLPATNQGMKGKEWVTFPYLKRSLKTGKTLLSVKKASTCFKAKTDTVYLLDGQEVNKDDYAHAMLGYEFKKGEVPNTFDLTGENVTRIHNYNIETEEEGETEGA